MDIVQKIRSRVNVNEETGCWEWQGARSSRGYGGIWIDKRCYITSRVMYASCVGPIPNGLWVLHRCDNPPCCNPDHLFLGDSQDNVNDRVRKGRGSKGRRVPTAKLRDEDIPAIIARLAAKEPQYRIARDYGISYIQIGEIKRGRSWKHVSGGAVAEARTTAKVTAEIVRAIRQRAAAGELRRLLAVEFGICRASVDNIVNRVTWPDVA